MPHGAVAPTVISAYIITALQTLISREPSPFSPAVITIGTIRAGTAFNIIPESVELQGTMRAFSEEDRARLLRRITEIAHAIAAAMAASSDVKGFNACLPSANVAPMPDLVHKAAPAP